MSREVELSGKLGCAVYCLPTNWPAEFYAKIVGTIESIQHGRGVFGSER